MPLPLKSLLDEAVLVRAGWIDSVVLAGVLLAVTMSLLRYTRGTEFEILKIKFPVSAFPLSCLVYTLGHGYCTLLFVGVCRRVGVSPEAWQSLTLKGPIVFAGMLPRQTFLIHAGCWSIPVDRIPLNDPTLWLFYGFCVAIYFGFTWSCEIAGYSKKKTRVLVWLLLSANWIVGGLWAHAASLLNG